LDTNKKRRLRRLKEEGKIVLKMRGIGGRINSDGVMDEGSSADEGGGWTPGVMDIAGLMKSMEFLRLNMERVMKRISSTSKWDPMLEKLKADNVREIRNVRR
jgi:hypothetical protein